MSEADRVDALLEALRRIERWADEAEEGWYPGGIAGDALAAWNEEAKPAPPSPPAASVPG